MACGRTQQVLDTQAIELVQELAVDGRMPGARILRKVPGLLSAVVRLGGINTVAARLGLAFNRPTVNLTEEEASEALRQLAVQGRMPTWKQIQSVPGLRSAVERLGGTSAVAKKLGLTMSPSQVCKCS